MRPLISPRRFRVGFALLLTVLLSLAGSCAQPAPPEVRALSAARQDVALALEAKIVEARVPARATLESLLRKHEVPAQLVASMAAAIGGVFNPRQIRAERPYRLTLTLDGLFREFRYEIDAARFLRVALLGRAADGSPRLEAEVVSYPRTVEIASVELTITHERPSLVAALDEAGEGLPLALALADIFGGEIDFNSDLQPGDRAIVLVERVVRDGVFIEYGDLKGAVFDNEGRQITAIRFVGADGRAGYYDEQGRSLKRQFLRSPLPFEPRITSRFSYRRLHPLHGDYRAHLGVDYGAPSGTSVLAVAAGTVTRASWSGEAGRLVEVRHPGGYETQYLHLSGFGPGIRPGVRVGQGQLIGRVGATGAATGPHLDYRLKRNGAYVNPLVELRKIPPSEPIPPEAFAAFARERDQMTGDGGVFHRFAHRSKGTEVFSTGNR